MKVDLQTKCTVTVVVADAVVFIITFISQETISNNLHVSMNSVGRCNHEVTVSVILANECVYIFFALHKKKRIYTGNISKEFKNIFFNC